MIDYLFESAHPGGTYACVIPSTECRETIFRFCVELGLENLVDPDEYHCTIIYSKEACPGVATENFELPFEGMFTNFEILGTDKKVLVMKLYCPAAKRLHEKFKEVHGATHDYPEYIPHITIAEDFQGEIPHEVFKDVIEFTGMKVEELT